MTLLGESATSHTVPPSAGVRRGSARSPRWWGYIFVAPNLLAVVVFMAFPLEFSLYMSVQKWDLFTSPTFVGARNFRTLVTADPLFVIALRNTVVFTLGTLIPTIVIGLVLAAMLRNRIRGVGIYRTILFLPLAVSSVVMALVWQYVFNTDGGLLNLMLGWIGVGPVPWLVDPKWAMVSLCLVGVWKSVPFATGGLAGRDGGDIGLVVRGRQDRRRG